MSGRTIHLGYELGTGEAVGVPVNHLAITGQTQMSGKTTTLEALISRSGLRAVAFVTKRAEGAFRTGRKIPACFRERADWRFVAAVLESVLRERMKWERAFIMRVSKGAHSLADVHRNVKTALEKARGKSADMYLMLDEYLQIVIPQVERLRYTATLTLEPGLNIMDLSAYSSELQALVIRSVLEWVNERESGVITVIPEAWEFLPQKRGSPVKLEAVEYVRKGAGAKNYLWLDSQDLAGVDAEVRKQVIVWILGVQREANEVKRTLAHIPGGAPKPTVAEVMELERGQFIACFGKHVIRVYVQPAWMDERAAVAIARGEVSMPTVTAGGWKAKVPDRLMRITGGVSATAVMATVGVVDEDEDDEEDEMDRKEREGYEERIADLKRQLQATQDADAASTRDAELLRVRVAQLEGEAVSYKEIAPAISALRRILGTPAAAGNGAVDIDVVVAEVIRRIPAAGGAVYQVAPVEKLRKNYQQEEVVRLLEVVRELPDLAKRILAMVETTEGRTGQEKLAARLGRSFGGNARVTFTTAVKQLAAKGLVDVEERQGVAKALRAKIGEDLSFYQASDAEVEATYQAVMAVVAGAPSGTEE